MQQLFLPQYALWEAREDWRACWFSGLPTDTSKSSLDQIFGALLGMRVDSGSSVGLSFEFPLWLWAQSAARHQAHTGYDPRCRPAG